MHFIFSSLTLLLLTSNVVVFGGRDLGSWVKFAFLHVTLTVPKLSREQIHFGFFEQSLANFCRYRKCVLAFK